MCKKFIEHYGLKGIFKGKEQPNDVVFLTEEQEQTKKNQFEQLKNEYVGSDDLFEEHINFLNRIIEDENNRQSVIESKLGQIIGQSGLIFTLIALFAPFFYDQLNGTHFIIKLALIILFSIGFLFFLLSIFQATKSFNIKNFAYSRPDIKCVIDKSLNSKASFNAQIIKDYITGIPINSTTNSKKGNLLLYAHRSFTFGFVSISILALIVTISLIFKGSDDKIIYTKDIDKIIRIENQLDVLNLKVDDLSEKYSSYISSKEITELKRTIANLSDSLNVVKMELEKKGMQLSKSERH